jgi:aspartate aminotransferase
MGFLSDASSRIKPSATIVITQKARDLKAQGRDVISLPWASPISTPRPHQGSRHRGDPPGRDQVSARLRHRAAARGHRGKYKRENGLDYKPSQTIVAPAASR